MTCPDCGHKYLENVAPGWFYCGRCSGTTQNPAAVLLGALGGANRSKAKREAAKRNGKLGGAPKGPRKPKDTFPRTVWSPAFKKHYTVETPNALIFSLDPKAK